MADNPSSSNVAGELQVVFKANTAPLKDATADVKQELQSVGEEGGAAGASIGGGMATAAAGAAAAAAAIVKLMQEFKKLSDEAKAYEMQRGSAFDSQESHLTSLLGKAQQLSDYERERARINQELSNTQQKIGEETAKYLDAHGSLFDSAGRLLGVEKSVSQVIKDQNADMREAADLREKQIEALNLIVSSQAESNNLLRQAALTGDTANVERERARQEIAALEQKRNAVHGPGSYEAVGELNETIRLRKLELDEVLKKIDAMREERALHDMQAASEQALSEARRKMREEEQEAREKEREHAREMARAARERLQIEREITQQKKQQQSGFGLGNVTFGGSRAMQSALNQSDISRIWSD